MEKKLLIIGMSPGNGYFKQEVIDKLIPFGLEKTNTVGIFIPDVPAISTYIALGYPENIARREKAIPQGNSFRNRIQKTITAQKLSIENIIIFDWKKEEIENKKEYREVFQGIKNLYVSNQNFFKDINSATEHVLISNQFRKKELTNEDIEIDTHYILSEFAFMLFLPFYLREYSHFIYGYHKDWTVFENFINGFYDNKPRKFLEFLKLPDFT